MKIHFISSIFILQVLITSCTSQPAQNQISNIQSTQTSQAVKSAATAAAATAIVANGGIVSTDPDTFSLASGRLQLVEFFSFT